MKIYIENEYSGDITIEAEKIIKEIIEACLDYIQCPYEASVEVLLTHDDAIRDINLENRGLDKSTDVLSFPMLEYEQAGNFSFLEEQGDVYFDGDTGELLLGDMVISMDHVKHQAEEYGHSMERELAFLVAHSMLHLFGFDHEEENQRIEMEAMQEEILNQTGYTRY